jgi:hypothetical protein
MIMDFQHSDEIWRDFPQLAAGAAFATGISSDAAADDSVARFTAIAKARLAGATESELPEIQAWRRAFTAMGFKPTSTGVLPRPCYGVSGRKGHCRECTRSSTCVTPSPLPSRSR